LVHAKSDFRHNGVCTQGSNKVLAAQSPPTQHTWQQTRRQRQQAELKNTGRYGNSQHDDRGKHYATLTIASERSPRRGLRHKSPRQCQHHSQRYKNSNCKSQVSTQQSCDAEKQEDCTPGHRQRNPILKNECG
jgi:hypothetical protein